MEKKTQENWPKEEECKIRESTVKDHGLRNLGSVESKTKSFVMMWVWGALMECGIHRCTFNCGIDFSIPRGQPPQ